jgi:hypothetical protein
MKLQKLVLATILAITFTTAHAGNFVNLTNGNAVNLTVANGGLILGTNSNAADPLFIQTTGRTFLNGYSNITTWADGGTGHVVETSINYRAFSGANTVTTGTLTLLDWRKTDNVPLLAGIPQATVYDFVYRDSADGKLVFGSRFLNQVANSQEFNFTYRYGFKGFTAVAAWTFVTDSDLRLYEAGRTNDHSYNTSVTYDADAIRLKGDYSVSEGNPWSALDLVKTNATSYALSNSALGFYQAGQEGQAIVGNQIAGFIPTNDSGDVPLPSWVLLLMTATLFAIKFKNEKRFSR